MASASFVFRLPVDVITSLLGQWITLVDISRLDRCISHIHLRKKFLDIISSDAMVYDGGEVGAPADGSYFAWLYSRNLSVRRIKTGTRTDSQLGFYLQDKEKVCRKLRELDLSSGATLHGLNLSLILPYCPLLEHFLLCEPSSANILDVAAIESLATHSKRLQIFELFNNREINSDTLPILLRGCSKLVELHFHFCYGIDDLCLQQIGEHCKQLRRFTSRPNDAITDLGALAIARNCPQLVGFNIFACSYVSNNALREICRSCPQLQEITLSAMKITDEVLRAIAACCPHLRILVVARCNLITAEAVMCVVDSCAQLQSLDIRYCHKLPPNLADKIEMLLGRNIKCVSRDTLG